MTVKTLGILGGGQLGRMSVLAAARLGIKCVVLTPEDDSPASHVAWKTLVAAYEDTGALKTFSDLTDVISYEFENIPVSTVDYLNTLKPDSVFPSKKLLKVSQDRVAEKTFLNGLGIETARWIAVETLNDIARAIAGWKSESFVVKTTRFGYDGKGQIFCPAGDIHKSSDLTGFLESHAGIPLILEDGISFTDEISVIVARDRAGKTAIYGPMLNDHKNHILHKTTIPAPHNLELCAKAVQMTKQVAEAVDLTGVLTVEFFVTRNGRLLANEIAPRTHNSGHWTIDACAVSQFEQHVRTVCGLPLGSAERHCDAVMLNLIGPDVLDAGKYLNQKNACLHLYGKQDVREGRKMGHVTFLEERKDDKSRR